MKKKVEKKVGYVIITPDYRVMVEEQNLVLQRRIEQQKDKEKVKDKWINEGYFGQWKNIIAVVRDSFIAKKVHLKKQVTLNEFLEILKESNIEVAKLFGEKS